MTESNTNKIEIKHLARVRIWFLAKAATLTKRPFWLASAILIVFLSILSASGLFLYNRQLNTLGNNQVELPSKEALYSATQFRQARDLVSIGKLDEADSILLQIEEDAPVYAKVLELQQEISVKKDELAKKAAEEAKAAEAARAAQQKSNRKTVPPTQFVTSIVIKGDSTCQSSTLSALKLLNDNAPTHYSIVKSYVGVIECVSKGSGMAAFETPPRYMVGDATRNAGTVWFAGTIAHDAGHSRLYHDYLSNNPGQSVPNDVWTGEAAERTCLEAQYDALSKIGATQSQLDYVRNIINSQYYNTPYDQRWW